MLREIECLREIARRCRASQPLETHHLELLGHALEMFLEQKCRGFEEAIGLRTAKGGIPWWLEDGIRKRDRALRELATKFCANLSTSACAKHISNLSTRYAATAWRFDEARPAMPEHYRGKEAEYLWRAFKSQARMPLGERRLRSILAGIQDHRTEPAPYGLEPA